MRCISLKDNHAVTTIEDGEEQPGLSQAFYGCAVAPDGNLYVTTAYNIVKVTFPRVTSPIVVPPSTLKADMTRFISDSNLIPDGKVAFNVGFPGKAKRMTAAIGRNILFVRSPYFASMFTAGNFKTQDVVDVDDCDYDTFQAMLVYLTKDSVEFTRNDAALAFELLKLARKHGLVRLEALCMHHLDENGALLTPGSVVPLLEGARHRVDEDDGRMFDTYRKYMLDHGSEVVEAGGLEQLQEHAPVTKGLLCDAYAEVKRSGRGPRRDMENPKAEEGGVNPFCAQRRRLLSGSAKNAKEGRRGHEQQRIAHKNQNSFFRLPTRPRPPPHPSEQPSRARRKQPRLRNRNPPTPRPPAPPAPR